jgi:hypothetical protein
MGGTCSTHGTVTIQVTKPQGEKSLAKPRLKWEDNIKTDLRKIVKVVDWIKMAQYIVKW